MPEEAPALPLPSPPAEGEAASSPLSPDVWVPALRRVTPRTRLLRVPAGSAFLPYLLDDAVVVPGGGDGDSGDDVFSEETLAASRTARSPVGGGGCANGGLNGSLANGVVGHPFNGSGSDSSSSSSGSDSGGSGNGADSDGDSPPVPPVSCPADVIAAITAALSELGTDVSPKFGGRCPTDAGWVSFHRSHRSSTTADVLLLLKSSERVAAAVADAVARGSSSSRSGSGSGSGSGSAATAAATARAVVGPPPPPFWLLLRAWVDMSEGVEVRAFVAAGRVVALCTREDRGGVGATGGLGGGNGGGGLLSTEAGKRQVVAAVQHLWTTTVATALGVDALVLDVYVDRSRRAWVVDVAPSGEAAGVDALLFTWAELQSMAAAAAAAADGNGEWHPWLRCAAEGGDAPPLAPSRVMYDGVPLELRQPGSTTALVAAATDMVNRERRDAERGR